MTEEEKTQIHRKQFELAMDGDARMLMWLGKNYLGQKENPDFTDRNQLCEGFDLKVIEFSECSNKNCKCVDCGKDSIDI